MDDTVWRASMSGLVRGIEHCRQTWDFGFSFEALSAPTHVGWEGLGLRV